MKRLDVKNARSGETVAPNAYLADNPLTRLRGLFLAVADISLLQK